MSLSVIFGKAGTILKNIAGNGALMVKAHAPEIMIGAGIAGFGATIYETVKATNKTNDIVEEKERTIRTIVEMRDECSVDEYSMASYERDLREANRRSKWGVVRAWAPVATLGGASVISILGGYKVLNGRYVATAAAYKVLENGFDRYRGNVVEKFGRETDWEMLHGIKAEELEKAREEQRENKEIEADNKRKKLHKKRKKTAYSDIYSRIFDEYSDRWQRYWNGQQVLNYLQVKENELNDMLAIRGHVFLNEVYDKLGMERTAEGAVVGWIKSAHNRDDVQNRNIVQIVSNIPPEEIRRIESISRNEDIQVRICPNPDGLIYNLIDAKPDGAGLDYIERRKLDVYD